jgi:23S rRNA-/tRNA-specific pseudouridylate synthase
MLLTARLSLNPTSTGINLAE